MGKPTRNRPLYITTESGNRRRAWKPAKSVARRMRREVYTRDNYTCQAGCGYRIAPETIPDDWDWNYSPGDLSLDHVVPYSQGGPYTLANLQTLCIPCNLRKGAR